MTDFHVPVRAEKEHHTTFYIPSDENSIGEGEEDGVLLKGGSMKGF